jgi:hypothetical protein
MASIISAGTTSGTALNMAGDTSGILQLATNGSTTAITIDASQRAAFVAGTAAAPAITTTGDTNTGIFFSAADTIDFAEGGTACGQFDSSANFKFNSGYGSVVTAYGCRAWVNFDGTGVVAIRASGNVTSITDNGTGLYTVNLTTAMPDINYTIVGSSGNSASGAYTAVTLNSDALARVAPTTSAFRVATSNLISAVLDSFDVNISVFR